MEIEKLTIEELKNGYQFDGASNTYICNTCKKAFEEGEIFAIKDRFYDALHAVTIHIKMEHGDVLKQLLYSDSKYNTFTDNQKELLMLFYTGHSDKEIAGILGITSSSVRHQRFMFREKAKQAKMYLAIYEQMLEKKLITEETIIPVHSNATMVDDRYITTEKEKEQILKTSFYSLSPLKLKSFPHKEKKKIVILAKITEQLVYGRHYTEKELNETLETIYDDYAVLRRYLVDYGFMGRTDDCTEYWMK